MLLALAFSVFVAHARPLAPQIKIICKTVSEKTAGPKKLSFHLHLPFQFEPEDPTVPFGRQVVILAARPVVQVLFEKSLVAAGERGENLTPGTCAYAKRPLGESDPSLVQVFLPAGQVSWMSQSLGSRVNNGADRLTISPVGDWSIVGQFEKVFVLEVEDRKNFVTTLSPKAI